jgi:hypothetical protein
MTLKQFLELPPNEQEMFKSKLLAVFNKHESFFMYATLIVDTAEEKGFLKHVKYGTDEQDWKEHPAKEMIGAVPIS